MTTMWGDVLEVFAEMRKKGLFKSEGRLSQSEVTSFDIDVLKFLGVHTVWSGNPNDWNPVKDYEAAIETKKLNVSWLLGPHAHALFKAKLIKQEGQDDFE